MSMSTPARNALRAASASSAAMPWASNSWMPAQSEVTMPSKPHSLRSTPVSRPGFAMEGRPFTTLKAAITASVPASTAALKDGR
jgi:hypothetical protein